MERGSALQTPVPGGFGGDTPFTALAGDLPPPKSPRLPRTRAESPGGVTNATVLSGAPVPAQLDSTLDMASTASKKATQAALIEKTRISGEAESNIAATSAVPAPGLFIADEPLEPRPKQPSLVTAQREQIVRMRSAALVLGGLFMMAAGALVVMFFRRAETNARLVAPPPASAKADVPACTLQAPPSRISPIERAVPLSAVPRADGSVALGFASSKLNADAFVYQPQSGEAKRQGESVTGSGDVSHVTAGQPLAVDRSSPEFAFGQTLSPGLAFGVGPAGLLRRGNDGATGVVWPLATGVRVTPPRVASLGNGHFVTFRQGGAEGQIMTGWLRPDGSAASDATPLEGLPKSLGTPSAFVFGTNAVALFSARNDKAEPYQVYAASAAPGHHPQRATPLDLPSQGGGAIAPSLSALPGDRYLVQWTDGNVGQYQVHVRIFDAALKPLSQPLQVSPKGANAGQGNVFGSPQAAVSFFIQTTAGHDELWGVALSCH